MISVSESKMNSILPSQINEFLEKGIIEITDSNDDLQLFSYLKCSDKSSCELKQYRGVIASRDFSFILKMFNYTPELTPNIAEIDSLIDESNLSEYTFFESHEGCMLRIFHYNNKWYVSTHRKLDAFKSKWSSQQSFGDKFRIALFSEYENSDTFKARFGSQNISEETICDAFFDTLDTSMVYMFFVKNTADNRIVCTPPDRPTVFHVGTFSDSGNALHLDLDVGLPYPAKHEFKSLKEICEFVNNVDCKQIQGLIVFSQSNVLLKLINSTYQKYFDVRGNEVNLTYRYIQIRNDEEMVKMLYEMYPEKTREFDNIESDLYDIAKKIYYAYVSRYLNGQYVILPKDEYTIMCACHEWHMQNRELNKISLNQVIKIIDERKPLDIYKLVHGYNLRLKTHFNGQST